MLRTGLRSTGEPVRLASGVRSSHFVDAKRALSKWADLHVACQAIHQTTRRAGILFDAVGGPALGAVPLAVGVAAVGNSRWFTVRKPDPSAVTTGWTVEGALIGRGHRVLLVDDVTTSGGSLHDACRAVTESGADVAAVATLVDRGDHAHRLFERLNVPYLPILTYRDLGIGPVAPPA